MPLHITKEALATLLDPATAEQKGKLQYRYQNTGPGQIDRNASYYYPQRKCFISPEFKVAPKTAKKRIIFSDPLSADTPLTEEERNLWSAIFEHGYEVVLMPNPNDPKTPIEKCIPLKDVNEFFKLRGTAYPANLETINETLKKQKLDPLNYLPITRNEWERLIAICKESTKKVPLPAEDTLDLSNIKDKEKIKILLSSITPEAIKKITIGPKSREDIIFILKSFPNLTELTVKYADNKWAKKNYELLKNIHLKFVHFNEAVIIQPAIGPKKITFSQNRYPISALKKEKGSTTELYFADGTPLHDKVVNYGIEKANIIGAYPEYHKSQFKKLNIDAKIHEPEPSVSASANPMRLIPQATWVYHFKKDTIKHKSIIISINETKDYQLYFDSKSAPFDHIKRLNFQNFQKNLDLKQFPNLEHLAIYSTKREDGLTHFGSDEKSKEIVPNKIKELILSSHKIQEISSEMFPELQELTLFNNPILTSLGKTKYPNIKYLKLNNSMLLENVDLTLFPNLQHLEIYNANEKIQMLDLKAVPQLRSLEINNCKGIKNIDLTPAQNLQDLKVDFIANFENAKNLKHLRVKVEKVKLLDITSCHELETLNLFGSSITEIKASHLPKLKEITGCYTDRINKIDLCHSGIQAITCSESAHYSGNKNSPPVTIDIAGCTQLQTVGKLFSKEMTIISDPDDNFPYLRDFQVLADKLNIPNLVLPEHCRFNWYAYTSTPPADTKNTEDKKNDDFGYGNGTPGTRGGKKQKPDYTPAEIMRRKQLMQKNNKSPVDKFYFKDSSASVDNKTDEDDKDLRFAGNVSLSIHARKAAVKNYYRNAIIEGISLTHRPANSLYFYSKKPALVSARDKKIETFDDIKVATLKRNAEASTDRALAYLSLKNLSYREETFPLPTQEPLDPNDPFEIYCNPPGSITLFWDESSKRYYAKHNGASNIDIIYYYKRNYAYEQKSDSKLTLDLPTNLLVPGLITHIDKLIDKNPKLAFLKDANKSIEKKLIELTEYCQGFSSKPLKMDNPTPTQLEILFAEIEQQAGSCRHRSQSFMLLAHHLGVPVKMIESGMHAFCEVPYQDGARRIDLGGALVNDLTDENEREDIIQKIADKTELSAIYETAEQKEARLMKELAEIKKQEEKMQVHRIEELKKYQVTFKQAQHIDQITAAKLKHLPDDIKPLVELSSLQDPLTVYPGIIDTLDAKQDYFYVHTPDEFENYLLPYCHEGNERKRISGPIAKILEQGGTLIVNWSNFNPAEVINYQSILDKIPNLSGKPLSPKVKVIGLIKPETVTCRAFKSRCKRYAIPDLAPKAFEQKEAKTDKVEFDLFSQPNWRDHLIEKITYAGDKMVFTPGPLLQAIEEGKSLHIFNPPNDEDFNMLMHRIKHERRLFHNGRYINVHPNIKITTSAKSHDDLLQKTTDNIKIVNEDPRDEKPRSRIYLGLYNLHECYESLRVDEKNQAYSENKGYFDDYTEQKEFYITDAIPRSSWEILLNHIHEHKEYAKKKFRFVLAPGAFIEDVAKNDNPAFNSPASIRFSSDCDYTVKELRRHAGEKVLIIDATPQTTYQDLIAQVLIKQGSDKITFTHEKSGMLEELIKEHHVILNGELSPRLYQQLLPLLLPNVANSAHIDTNNTRVNVKGKLTCVIPLSAKEKYNLTTDLLDLKYTEKDYIHEFKESEKEVKQILTFYQYAKKVYHVAPGYPAPPELSYAKLNNMLNILKNSKLHARNPLKPLFHYYYKQSDLITAKSSEDYAYLNVIAKCIFRPNDDKKPRAAKLKKLLQQIQQEGLKPENYIWQILNCYSGQELMTLFNNDINHILDDMQKVPLLKPNLLEKVLVKIGWKNPQDSKDEKANNEPEDTKKKSSIEKRKAEVKELSGLTKLINLRGAPGVGKSYFIEELKAEGITCYEGNTEAGTNQWINDTSDKIKALFIDEANMDQPGTYDFLKTITRNEDYLYHQRKFHFNKITPKHIIIITGNPENYAGRHIHKFFQDYGCTVYFKMPGDEALKDVILKDFSNRHGDAHINNLLSAYRLIKKTNPNWIYSIRDLKNAALTFDLLSQDSKENKNQLLLKVCIAEFAGTIENQSTRLQFINQLSDVFKCPSPAHNLQQMQTELIEFKAGESSYLFPKDKEYVLNAIADDLNVRNKMLADSKTIASSYYKKPGFLLEGDPGIGKSTLFRMILQKSGLTEVDPFADVKAVPAENAKKCFIEINAGDNAALENLQKAFDNEWVVILNEPNVQPELERKAIELLDKAKNKPGFRIYASQNPSGTHEGRMDASPALSNRLNFHFVPPYSRDSLIAIAKMKLVEFPEDYVDIFINSGATMRTFFNDVNRHEKLGKLKANYYLNEAKKLPSKILLNPYQAFAQKGLASKEVAEFLNDLAELSIWLANPIPDIKTPLPPRPELQDILKTIQEIDSNLKNGTLPLAIAKMRVKRKIDTYFTSYNDYNDYYAARLTIFYNKLAPVQEKYFKIAVKAVENMNYNITEKRATELVGKAFLEQKESKDNEFFNRFKKPLQDLFYYHTLSETEFEAIKQLIKTVQSIKIDYTKEKILWITKDKTDKMNAIENGLLSLIENASGYYGQYHKNFSFLNTFKTISKTIQENRDDIKKAGTLIDLMSAAIIKIKNIYIESIIKNHAKTEKLINALKIYADKNYDSLDAIEGDKNNFIKLCETIQKIFTIRQLKHNPSKNDAKEIQRIEDHIINYLTNNKQLISNDILLKDLLLSSLMPTIDSSPEDISPDLFILKQNLLKYLQSESAESKKEVHPNAFFQPASENIPPAKALFANFCQHYIILLPLLEKIASQNLTVALQLHEMNEHLKSTEKTEQQANENLSILIKKLHELEKAIPRSKETDYIKEQLSIYSDYYETALKDHQQGKPFPLL